MLLEPVSEMHFRIWNNAKGLVFKLVGHLCVTAETNRIFIYLPWNLPSSSLVNWEWWFLPVIPAPGKLRLGDLEFEDNLGSIVRLPLKNEIKPKGISLTRLSMDKRFRRMPGFCWALAIYIIVIFTNWNRSPRLQMPQVSNVTAVSPTVADLQV